MPSDNSRDCARQASGRLLNGRWTRRYSSMPLFTSLCVAIIYSSWIWTAAPLTFSYTTNVETHMDSRGHFLDHELACDRNIDEVNTTWKSIDETLLKDYSSKRISGGIFLYPRQASLLSTLARSIADRLIHRRITVCETGFGSGHSLALFAHSASSIQMVSFDKFDRQYQLPIWKKLNQTYTHHTLDYVAGDSCRTVPAVLSGKPAISTSISTPTPIQCDILHGSSLCPTDNIDLVEHAPCGALLTSTAMATLNDPAVYFGPHAQWRKLRRRGCITNPICFEEAAVQLDRSFFFAEQGSSYNSQFCIAMTTGKCSKQGSTCNNDLYDVVSHLSLDQFCPRYRVQTPK